MDAEIEADTRNSSLLSSEFDNLRKLIIKLR
jgi:hypothetical protein